MKLIVAFCALVGFVNCLGPLTSSIDEHEREFNAKVIQYLFNDEPEVNVSTVKQLTPFNDSRVEIHPYYEDGLDADEELNQIEPDLVTTTELRQTLQELFSKPRHFMHVPQLNQLRNKLTDKFRSYGLITEGD